MTIFTALLDDYHRFRTADYRRQRDRWEQLAGGAIAQGDGNRLFGQPHRAGTDLRHAARRDLHRAQNVANLVLPYETTGGRHGVSAALEFAVTKLGVEEIVVMGHGACAAAGMPR